MSHLMNNATNTQEPLIISNPQSRPLQFSSTFSQPLPREIDTQLRELKTSISVLDKRPIVLSSNNDHPPEKELKAEIVKLNKEILGLQSDLYKLNTKYISKGLLSPNKAKYPQKTEDFRTPQREFVMDNEVTVRPESHDTLGNRILSELGLFQEKINRTDPLLFSRYFHSPENLRRLAAQMDYPTILLNLLQLVNEHLTTDCPRKPENPNPRAQNYPVSSNNLEAETKPIDFKNYFKNSFTSQKTSGILRNKVSNIPRTSRTPGPNSNRKQTMESSTIRKGTEEASINDSRCNSLDRESQQWRLYNNRSENERFAQEEQCLDIDEITHKKKVKQPVGKVAKRKRNMDIITNMPKKKQLPN